MENPSIKLSALPKDVTILTFEEALKELEILVRKLEEGRVPLKEAMLAYERGTQLRHHCEKVLNEARLTIDQIMISSQGDLSIVSSPLENNL